MHFNYNIVFCIILNIERKRERKRAMKKHVNLTVETSKLRITSKNKPKFSLKLWKRCTNMALREDRLFFYHTHVNRLTTKASIKL